MKVVDLNVLLYAVNENSVHHAAALRWWERALNGDETIGLPWVVDWIARGQIRTVSQMRDRGAAK